MSYYLFRSGDGNEGNYPKLLLKLEPGDDPVAALEALIANEYAVGSYIRRYIVTHAYIDGDPENGWHFCVAEGPYGETAFGSAWLTAELQPIKDSLVLSLHMEQNSYLDIDGKAWTLRKALDNAAWRLYRRRRAA